MELFDLYDENRIKQNKTIQSGKKISCKLSNVIVKVCVFDSLGKKMLIQQRSASKSVDPNCWDVTIGGHVKSGESSAEAASRELFEEVGINYNFKGDKPYLTFNYSHEFVDYYFMTKDINIDKLKFNDGEVQSARWATEEEILELIDKKIFVCDYKELISLLFRVRQKCGAIKHFV